MCRRDFRLHLADDSHQSSAARFALSVPPVAAGAPAFVPVSVVAPAAYSPADSAPHSFAVLAQTTVPPAPRPFPAPSAIPRVGVSVSSLFTFVASDSRRLLRPPAPAAAGRSTAQNPKSHRSFPAPTYSG